MWCLISQPNAVVFEVRVDPKAIGHDCLEKACEYLGILKESDYFGLKYENNKSEELWLNLRNPIEHQVHCHQHTSPLRLALRVKFWVPPHLLLQESTRHQFYLHARLELTERRLVAPDWECAGRLIALATQAEAGDQDPSLALLLTAVGAAVEAPPTDLVQRVTAELSRFRGMRAAAAEYWLLKVISEWSTFGEERFTTKCTEFGVGPHGLTVACCSAAAAAATATELDHQSKQLITFSSIISAASHRRSFRLVYLSADNAETQLVVKLDSSHMASSLYRSITEKHAFYSCETVRTAVTSQFIRDLKGTIASIFNEGSTLGKKYVFDIRKTCREVYDNARRALYLENNQLAAESLASTPTSMDEIQKEDSSDKLNKLLDAMTCKICMDKQIDAVFLPCAHVLACSYCASRCERCPLCRAGISQSQKLFLPGEFRQIIDG